MAKSVGEYIESFIDKRPHCRYLTSNQTSVWSVWDRRH